MALYAFDSHRLQPRRSPGDLVRQRGGAETAILGIRFLGLWDIVGGNGNFGLNWISLDWMYAAAIRAGLPIDPAAVVANRVHGALAMDIDEHKHAIGPKRHIFAADLLHASVVLDRSVRHHQHNDPAMPLRRVTNEGTILPAV